MSRARLLVVDDQPLFAEGIALVLGARPEFDVVGRAGDGAAALELVGELRPDLVLLDLRMPGLSGLQVLQRLRGRGDTTRVVVLTTLRHERAVYEALRAGAAAFLTKDAPPDLLADTLRRVLEGDAAVGAPELTRLLRSHGAAAAHPVVPLLTPRENVILRRCAEGLSNQEIAEREQLGVATVKTQVGAVLRKLGLSSRVQLAVYAYENQLVRPALDPRSR